MVDNLIIIDDTLRFVLARLEGDLGVFFTPSEIARVFADAADDQISEKNYVFFESPQIHVGGIVEEYEPESITITVHAPKSLVTRCQPILEDAYLRSR